MRIHVGAGYRIYYLRKESTIYVVLAGGVKASQVKDIAKAKKWLGSLKGANREKKENHLQTIRRGGLSR